MLEYAKLLIWPSNPRYRLAQTHTRRSDCKHAAVSPATLGHDMPAKLKSSLGHHAFLSDHALVPDQSLTSSIAVFQLILVPAKRALIARHSLAHSLATSHSRRELGAFGFVSRQQRLSCRAAGFHIGVLLKQRDGKAKTLAPMESRALVSPSLYRRLMVSRSQPFMLTLAK